MTFRTAPLLVALICLLGFSACSESNDDTDPTYADWQARNDAYFMQTLRHAAGEVAKARATYGDDWEQHCDWRVFRSYAKTGDAAVGVPSTDSIAVRILHRGTGSGCPLYTDSVRVNFIGRLIPNALSTDATDRTTGHVFTYTGTVADSAMVFSPAYCAPVQLAVSNNVEGFTTALMRMHIGDLWRIYVPSGLAYGVVASNGIPAYSTLTFDLELKAYYRTGVSPGPWK